MLIDLRELIQINHHSYQRKKIVKDIKVADGTSWNDQTLRMTHSILSIMFMNQRVDI